MSVEKKAGKAGVAKVFEQWRQKQHKKRLPSKFQKLKETKVLPLYKLKFSAKLQGRLFQVKSQYGDVDYVHLHFFKHDLGRLGTYKKTIPVGENVFATGRVVDYLVKDERKEQNAIEVFTTRGLGFIFWRELKFLKPSVDG